jgi:hypothetical protein
MALSYRSSEGSGLFEALDHRRSSVRLRAAMSAGTRAAVVLVPDGDRAELAATLSTQLGRGDRQLQLSLNRALIALGEVILLVLAAR